MKKFHQIQAKITNRRQNNKTTYTLPNNTQSMLCLEYVLYDMGAVVFTATGAYSWKDYVIKNLI